MTLTTSGVAFDSGTIRAERNELIRNEATHERNRTNRAERAERAERNGTERSGTERNGTERTERTERKWSQPERKCTGQPERMRIKMAGA